MRVSAGGYFLVKVPTYEFGTQEDLVETFTLVVWLLVGGDLSERMREPGLTLAECQELAAEVVKTPEQWRASCIGDPAPTKVIPPVLRCRDSGALCR